MAPRWLVGLLLAGAAVLLARRARSLSGSGAVAATLVGGACVAAGWRWGALLVAYFVASSLLSHWREDAKARRTADVVAKGGERDAMQVVANGGAYAAAALVALAHPSPLVDAFGLGALAAATADTWATETGTVSGGTPRMLTTGRPVPAGTSGGVTLVGTLGGAAGALFVAGAALALGWRGPVVPCAALGGIMGSLADSLLGATVQARRRCDACGAPTERLVHRCGTATRPAGGLQWLDNDRVNLLAALAGGATALALALWRIR